MQIGLTDIIGWIITALAAAAGSSITIIISNKVINNKKVGQSVEKVDNKYGRITQIGNGNNEAK